MKLLISLTILTIALHEAFAPPVTNDQKDDSDIGGLQDYMEYHRYLKEVIHALESDPDFKKKLENANENDVKSGKIAEELKFVSHHVRNRLDEIKRVELDRLRELTERKRDLMQGLDPDHPSHKHLDPSNIKTFEIKDLQKLIAKTAEDLAEADRKRKENFKEYELQKEFERQQKLNSTNGDDRVNLEKQYKEIDEKHKKHEKLHEPGHKAQLEEVWEEQDQMQQEFDPKTFFMLHDLDSNGLWDQDEVKALFIKELDKMYSAGAPEDDMRERAEEMERMRESVFKEVDLNQDGFIDFNEFLIQTKRNDFKQDHGWQGIDEQRPYTDEELEMYIQQQRNLHAQQGYVGPNGYPYPAPPGQQYYPQQQYHPGQVPPQQYHPQQQMHPGQIPQQQMHPGQVPQQQMHHGQVPQQQMHHGQVPQQQMHPGQVPQQQMHPGQIPQQQMHPRQIPQQQMHSGQVLQQQMHPGQVPQQQMHPGQVPQQQMHPGQVPQQQMHPGQVPQKQGHPSQVQQQQIYSNEIPQQPMDQGKVPQHPQVDQTQQNVPQPVPDLNTNEIYSNQAGQAQYNYQQKPNEQKINSHVSQETNKPIQANLV